MKSRLQLEKIKQKIEEVIKKANSDQIHFASTENLAFMVRDILNKLQPYSNELGISFYNIRNYITHKFYAIDYHSLVSFVKDYFPTLQRVLCSPSPRHLPGINKNFLENSDLYKNPISSREYNFVQIFYDKLVLFEEVMKSLDSPITAGEKKQELLNMASFIFENCYELFTKLLPRAIVAELAKNRAQHGFVEVSQNYFRNFSAHSGHIELDSLREYVKIFQCDLHKLSITCKKIDKDSIKKRIIFYKEHRSIKDRLSASLDKAEAMRAERQKEYQEDAELESRRAILLSIFDETKKNQTPKKREGVKDETPKGKKEKKFQDQEAPDKQELDTSTITSSLSGQKSEIRELPSTHELTGDEIQVNLQDRLANSANIISPELGSVDSIFSLNKNQQKNAIFDCIKKITGYYIETTGEKISNGYIGNGEILTKPVVIPLNLGSARTQDSSDASVIGGTHWIVCVILPKDYITTKGQKITHRCERVFLVDSVGSQRNLPDLFMDTLKNGGNHTFSAPTSASDSTLREVNHVIPKLFSNAEFISTPFNFRQQQIEDITCGEWVVNNAVSIIETGSIDSLVQEATKREQQHADAMAAAKKAQEQHDESKLGSARSRETKPDFQAVPLSTSLSMPDSLATPPASLCLPLATRHP